MFRKFAARLVLVLTFAALALPAPRLLAQSPVVTGSDPQPGQPTMSVVAAAILPVLIAAATS